MIHNALLCMRPIVHCIEIISQRQVKKNSMAVKFSGNAPFTCQAGNGQALPCTSPYTFTNLREGKNTLTISSYTKSSQFVCSKRFDVTIEGISLYTVTSCTCLYYFFPELPCFNLISYKLSGNQLRFDFSGTDEFYCRFDDDNPVQCTSPWVVSQVTAGQHQVLFWDIKTNGAQCYRQYSVRVKCK